MRLKQAPAEEDFGEKIRKLKAEVSPEDAELVINSAFYCLREHAGTETKQPFINIVRQFIQKVVIGKTPGPQPGFFQEPKHFPFEAIKRRMEGEHRHHTGQRINVLSSLAF